MTYLHPDDSKTVCEGGRRVRLLLLPEVPETTYRALRDSTIRAMEAFCPIIRDECPLMPRHKLITDKETRETCGHLTVHDVSCSVALIP
jgi:hypothetical protein